MKDASKSGCPRKLTAADKKGVEAFVKRFARQPKTVLVKIQSELGKTISRNTLRRALKSMDHSYRRVKKSLRSKRDDQAFEAIKKRSNP